MGMRDFFYGEREPTYFVNHARRTPHYSQSQYMPYGHGGGQMAPAVELLVPMCCNKCEEKIRENMFELRGVRGVFIDRQRHIVTVSGFVDPVRALNKARKVKRDSHFLSGPSYTPVPDYLAPSDLHLPSDLEYRSSYTEPSKYRTSHSQYAPSYGTSHSQYAPSYGTSHSQYAPWYGTSYNRDAPSYGTSYNRDAPSYGHSYVHPFRPASYSDGYSPVVTNPYYMKHIESEY